METNDRALLDIEAIDLIGVPVCINDRDTDELLFISSSLCRIMGIPIDGDRVRVASHVGMLRTPEDIREHLESAPDLDITMNEYFPEIGAFLRRVSRSLSLSDGRSAVMHQFEQIAELPHTVSAEELLSQERESRKNFLIKMSHDIRAQLNTVNGIAVIEKRGASDLERLRSGMSKIEHATMNILTMLDNILEMSGVESLSEFDGFSDEPFMMPSHDMDTSMKSVREKSVKVLRAVPSCTVLLADDVDVHREIIEMFLEGTGVTVCHASDGAEALDLYAEDPGKYHLILMDLHMPEMSGYDAAKAIRSMSDERAKSVPMIAMTANAIADDEWRSFSVGMNGHLTKPIDLTDLLALMAYHLKDRAVGISKEDLMI